MVTENEKYREKRIYEKLARDIKAVRYGSIAVIIQDGKIIQMEKREKIRLV
ncbi:MAG: YezD family protein [Oscillospiraceae bacterium]|jgi:hypothetical protein|nr:YezD family protein [Oscillospiraceae bacterium]MCI1990771.1 YezD family protein [Oscillospiraceae bacterium]MCI2035160.1 YezD family protein [Oscillospiraceae bacterium]